MFLKSSLSRTAVLIALATAGVARAAIEPVRVTASPATSANVFARGEWSVDVGRAYKNPFDPKQIAVDATFTDADGRKLVLPAFWRPTDKGGENGSDKDCVFCVRFAPDKPGRWTMRVAAVDAAGRRDSQEQAFTVAPSNADPGLVRVAANKRYFRFDNGQTYFPVGINLAWPQGEPRVEWYESKFADMQAAGANWARVWMAHGPVTIENETTGLGRYDEAHAAYFDAVLDSAQKHGVRVELCFLNHRDLLDKDGWGPAGWPTSVYNAANHGPATRPIDFVTSEPSRTALKNRLRYIVARYSSYTAVMNWELMNEQEWARINIPTDWDNDLAVYLTTLDPYHRLVSTSASVPDAVWRLPDMAFTQAHLYGTGKQADLVPSILASVAAHEQFDKPHLIAEYGIDAAGDDNKFDPKAQGTAFHNALWAAALSGSAGSAMYWWWDGYVWPKGIYKEFKPLADFVRPIDFAGGQFKPLTITELKRVDATGYGDMVIPSAGGWGRKMSGPQTLPPNGRPASAIVTYAVGPMHSEQYAPIAFDVDLPAESKLTLRAGRVSDFAIVRVSVDGKPIEDVLFSATPGSPGITAGKWEDGHYSADIAAPRTLAAAIPAGKHRVTIDVVGGDWVTLNEIVFADALDNHYANLAAVAVQDAASKQTLAWLFDTRSTWKSDRDGPAPGQQAGVTMVVPNVSAGTWSAAWWDTHAGKTVRTDQVSTKDGVLTLAVPTFSRDIALRLTPAD